MSTTPIRFKLAVTAIGATAAILTASGCGNDTTSTGSGSSSATDSVMPSMSGSMPGMNHGTTPTSAAARSDYNDADVTFLQQMYPHHAQAVDMAKLVPARSQDRQVLDLAANIEKAQDPEMDQIAGLLASFGKTAPGIDAGHMSDMPGMMAPEKLDALKVLSGKDFDRMWLQTMIDHHNGAIAMSNTVLAAGINPDTKTLAQKIITNQQAEIDQMRAMLNTN